MRTMRRGFSPVEALPDDLRGMLIRRLTEFAGLFLLLVATLGALALASWSVQDPSLNHATDGPIANVLGFPGAVVADLLMQLLGLGSLAFLAPLGFWGWKLLSVDGLSKERLRVSIWPLATVLCAGFASALPVGARWPLPTGLGGVIGDYAFHLPGMLLMAKTSVIGHAITTIVIGFAATLSLVVACGFFFTRTKTVEAKPELPMRLRGQPKQIHVEPEDDEDHSGRLLGGLIHTALSVRAFFRRASRSQTRSRPRIAEAFVRVRDVEEDELEALPTGRTAERREPSFDAAARTRTEPRANARRPMEPVALDAPDEDDATDPPFSPDKPSPRRSLISAAEAVERDVSPPTSSARIAAAAPAPKPSKRITREAQPGFPFEENWDYPPVTLLAEPKKTNTAAISHDALEQNARLLEGVLDDFGVRGEIIHVRPGPVVTLYELEPAPGTKSSRVIGLADDIARSMSAVSARVAVVPGRNAIGIELPNQKRETVYFRELIGSEDYEKSKFKLPLCLGKTIGGEPVIAELAKMPHLLVAGTTGSGKSVAINTMILSLLYRLKPEECRLIMVDPKMLELSVYDGIPHLLAPVVTDPKKAVIALKWAVREMEERYKKMSKLGVRNIDGYNQRAHQAKEAGENFTRTVQTGFDKETGEPLYEQEEMDLSPIPYIVVIVDEMADLMMVAGKDIEGAIQRLAQMARAAGIHLIMATQRPSVDVITGTIKANFPTRISFQVTSKIDSRTILGEMGAEQLLGQGDMLHMAGGGRISRVHGPFVSDDEVEKVVAHLKAQGRPDYLDAVTMDEDSESEGEEGEGGAVFDKGAFGSEEGGDLYDQAVKVVLRDKKCSTSYVQRRLQIGYNRAASLVERMEKEGIVGAANHAGKREILMKDPRASIGEEYLDDDE